MTIDHHITLDTMSEADLEPVLELLRGHDPDTVARHSGGSRTRLLRLRDDLLARIERERARVSDSPPEKIGRNAPCPCGSGKKYKHCCLNRRAPRHESAGQAKPSATGAMPCSKKILILGPQFETRMFMTKTYTTRAAFSPNPGEPYF